MKTRYLSFFLILGLFAFKSNASHYMGGEITWQCLGNGNYRFMMKLYRECNGITYNSTETMTITNYPGLTSVSMTLKPGANPHDIVDGLLDGRTDLSPLCYNPAMAIHCTPSPAIANTGAIEEWYYTSDSLYPNGVQLSGVPPAAGWIFSHSSCCRNPSSNLVNPTSASWFLRAIMYPFNGTNGFPCYDNSPVFAESPATVVCSGTPYAFNPGGFDPENDSLTYSWAPALNTSISNPMGYAGTFTYNSPFPGPSQNPFNIPATLNPHNGEISYTSYTNGAFVSVIKVAEYRNGIKIGEVFREFQSVISPCSANNAPFMAAPFYNPMNGLWEFTDTVSLGDVVDFDLTAIDYGTLPNGNPQTVTFVASGNDFGSGFTNPTAGCPNPPCATLYPPPVISAMMAVASHFHWQTSCSQMTNYATDSHFAYSTHNFYIQACDNYCPVPACQYSNVTVVIKTPLIKPIVTNVTDSIIQISWSYYSGFSGQYYIYRAINHGPFVLIDSTNSPGYTDMYNSVGQFCEYMICATDAGGCNWWSTVCSTAAWSGIRTNVYDKAISVFPNPANDQLYLNISSNDLKTVNIAILNSIGDEADHYIFTLAQNENTFTIPTAQLTSGLYIIKLTSKDINKFVKVLILH